MSCRVLAFVALAAALLVAGRPAAEAQPPARVQGLLQQLLKAESTDHAADFSLWSSVLRRNSRGEVQAYVFLKEWSPQLLTQLSEMGLRISVEDQGRKVVQGWVYPQRIRQLSQLPFVSLVREPGYLYTNTGLWQSEGDQVVQADLLRKQMDVNGAGIKVGVISDGVFGLLEAMATGDLPAGSKVCGNLGSPLAMADVGVECRSFRADGDITGGGDGSGVGAEGTALLEVIHDISPGAELFFANAATSLELGKAQDWLAETVDVDIIVDDLVTFNAGPYDGTSFVSEKTSSQVAKGKTYVNAVGNYGDSHYVGWFTDSDGDLIHEFDVSLGLPAEDGAGETLDLSLPAGGSTAIYVSWNDPFGASTHDCAVSLVSPAECPGCDLKEIVGFPPCSANSQNGVGDPVEVCGVARGDTPGTVGLVVSGCPGVELQIFVVGDAFAQEFVVPERSIPNNSDARDVISVGAVGFVGDEVGGSSSLIRSYSSRGPTADGRMKPAVVAPDGVTISGVGGFGFSLGGSAHFFGTSSAVPHVAGVAALLKQLDPGAAPACVAERLAGGAVDLGPVGSDSIYGGGRIDALAAADSACSSSPCEDLCCDLDSDCLQCAMNDCLEILKIVNGLRSYDCRGDLVPAGAEADGIDLLDAVLCLRRRAGLGPVSSCGCPGALPVSPSPPTAACAPFTSDQTLDGRSCLWLGPWATNSPLSRAGSLSDGINVVLLFDQVTPVLAFTGEITSGVSANMVSVAVDLDGSGEFEQEEFFAADGSFSLEGNGIRLNATQTGGTTVMVNDIAFERYRGAFQELFTGTEPQGKVQQERLLLGALRASEMQTSARPGALFVLPSGDPR